ncbi:hypothetical protein LJR130_003043 [Variovorax sp. LjRoot130]|uniref:hypothetical protein n=1 Tax=Variovorax sp. LjRoot130 TaxID=3342261 RepID=UPI003ECCE086
MGPKAIGIDFDFGSAGLAQGHAERVDLAGPHALSRILAVHDILRELLIEGRGVAGLDQRNHLRQAIEFLVV